MKLKTIVLFLILFISILNSAVFANSNNKSSNKDNIFEENYFQDPITKLKVPDIFPFEYQNEIVQFHRNQNQRSDNQNSIKKRRNDAYACRDALMEWKSNDQKNMLERKNDSCGQIMAWYFYQFNDIQPFADVLLDWALSDRVTIVPMHDDFNEDRYNARAYWSTFSSFYAYHYERFKFNVKERNIVDNYLLNKMININMDEVGESKKRKWCDPSRPELIGNKNIKKPADNNTCGSNRWKATIGQLMLGLRLKNQDLFDRGIYNTRFMLELFDEEGIFVTWAVRGALSWDYSNSTPKMLSLLVEIYNSLDFDFMKYQTRNGLTVKEMFDKYFEIIDDVSILEKYAVRQWAVKGTNYNNWIKKNNDEKISQWTKASQVFQTPRYIFNYKNDLAYLAPCNISPIFDPIDAITSFNLLDIRELYFSSINPSLCIDEILETIKREETLELEILETAKRAKTLELEKTQFTNNLSTKLDGLYSIKNDKISFNGLDAIFEEKKPPKKINSGKNRKISKRINGKIKLLNTNEIRIKSNISLVDIENTNAILMYVGPNSHKSILPLVKHMKNIVDLCGPPEKFGDDSLMFIVETNDLSRIRQQDCVYHYFKNSNDLDAFSIYRGLTHSTKVLSKYINQ